MADDSVWWGEATIEDLNDRSRGCLNEAPGIEITQIAARSIQGRMPVDARTIQPAGVLHGGASIAFAETLASWAGYLAVDRDRFHVVGQEINGNHVRPFAAGNWVYGIATPAHLGRRAQVWEIRITAEDGKLVCISRRTLAIIEQAGAYVSPEAR